jgi:hypothetical protein
VSGAALVAVAAATGVIAFHLGPFGATEKARALASAATFAASRVAAFFDHRSAPAADPAWVSQSLALQGEIPPLALPSAPDIPPIVWNAIARSHGPLVDPASSGGAPRWLRQSLSLQASLEPSPRIATLHEPGVPAVAAKPAPFADTAPLPPVRPAERRAIASAPAPTRGLTPPSERTSVAVAPAEPRSFFGRLFSAPQPSGPVIAYAAAETGLHGASSGYDRYTAVYDISAHVVYMPNGQRLEAHSGYGERLDDPRYVSERMRGATPPNVYELEPREQSFHGVDALRMKPIGGTTFGRAGLLAHSFMLGPRGDSNGCVSFKDYDAFLQAYRNGEVKRLAVVAKMD